MTTRPTLAIIDDPIAPKGRTQAPASQEPAKATSKPARKAAGSHAQAEVGEEVTSAAPVPPKAGYAEESKKAVFGRVPRSLTRRLERALVELREYTDDLTQEQLLAALLHRYVDPASPESLSELSTTVAQYRSQV